jgi:hypothetical protein
MGQGTPAPWNRGPVAICYGALVVVSVVTLRLIGRGWVGAITAGVVIAGVVTTLLVLVGGTLFRTPRPPDREDPGE